ncbi:hypothetical protein ECL_00666 [Enterobacter cloacae subsp. cloacae ATCC 13047]|uniref:Uncharacterized protein n=1 Tax=Enterobacter cloacae subsp. cloacae (strain ATCC 13047 / DSM 30054 / NBRC 13535 / NCTC 10005 / WDCM 00083 / NCDC 279-56) TaxID=716541 RepID=A0A0H3CG15_ENTCC|nr:hypothetical protein ECL_00666 [Enterobacter cloacae subsp. cloacae ATCC 13047]
MSNTLDHASSRQIVGHYTHPDVRIKQFNARFTQCKRFFMNINAF